MDLWHTRYNQQLYITRRRYNETTMVLNGLETEAEKFSILNEEMGHHFTSSGNTIDISIV